MRVAESLARHTTFRIGGPADVLAWPEDREDVAAVIGFARERGLPLTVLGRGSNVLVPDEGVRGLVISLERAADWVCFDGRDVEAGAGYPLPLLVREAARRGLAGLEGLAGVPGSVGGALAMNAGAGGYSIGGVTVSVEVIDRNGRIHRLSRDDMVFGYRSSRLQAGDLVALSARFRLSPGDPEAIVSVIERYGRRRRETQPLEHPNAGSIFKNPPGDSAGRLIEAAGCKGLRAGGAKVSERHANFIINTGGATAADVLSLMATVYRRVLDAFGVRLQAEIRLLGKPEGYIADFLERAGPLPAGGD